MMAEYCVFDQKKDAESYDTACIEDIKQQYPNVEAISWYNPRQRLDEKWIVLRLDNFPLPANCLVEPFVDDWFVEEQI